MFGHPFNYPIKKRVDTNGFSRWHLHFLQINVLCIKNYHLQRSPCILLECIKYYYKKNSYVNLIFNYYYLVFVNSKTIFLSGSDLLCLRGCAWLFLPHVNLPNILVRSALEMLQYNITWFTMYNYFINVIKYFVFS